MTTNENYRLMIEDRMACTEIDLNDREVRKTWKLMGFLHCRTYELDNHATVHIKDKSTILEGYDLTLFGVYLASRGRNVSILLTADLNEARIIEGRVIDFLKEYPRQ
jgi:hypothetical protein